MIPVESLSRNLKVLVISKTNFILIRATYRFKYTSSQTTYQTLGMNKNQETIVYPREYNLKHIIDWWTEDRMRKDSH